MKNLKRQYFYVDPILLSNALIVTTSTTKTLNRNGYESTSLFRVPVYIDMGDFVTTLCVKS